MRSLLIILSVAPAIALAEPQVVTDIAPVHSLVSAVMSGVGEPQLLLEANADPHHLALRPSQARSLASADAVFWIGPALTPWLEDPVDALSGQARAVALMKVPGTHLIDADDDDHDHGHVDPHAWLDPENGVIWVDAIARTLSELDPPNAALYTANAARKTVELAKLQADLARELSQVKDRRFLVAHDAFSYFGQRFDLSLGHSVTKSDAEAPSARQLAELRDELDSRPASCAFREPQQSDAVLETVLAGSDTPIAILDPLGSEIQPGAMLYDEMLRNLASTVLTCGQ